jgi:lipopolysaccharide export system protein LptA
MPTLMPSFSLKNLLPAAFMLVGATVAAPVLAEKADRSKPIVIEAERDLVADNQRQVVVYNGNAVLSQGTMILRAERIEVREQVDGYRAATALGSRAKPATWRQRRDGVDEIVEGSADRIDFDGKADTVRFAGAATLRRLRGAAVADEINGNVIVWDNVTEVFKVEGGASSASNPSGRVRAVLSPPAETASAPAAARPASTPSAAIPLAPVRALGEPR